MKYICYQTKTDFKNTGDALINKALLDVLRNYGNIKCNCSSDVSTFFIRELGITDSEKVKCKSEISFVTSILKLAFKSKKNKNQVYLVSGLGHQWGGSLKKCIRNFIAGLIFPLYKIFGIKIIKIGMSIGPISNTLAITEKIRSIFIDYYYVRDTKSLTLCHNIGIKKAKICPDMSWIYLIDKPKKLNNNNIVTISLRESILDEKNNYYIESMLKKCSEILEVINKKVDGNIKIYFIYQVEKDKFFCDKAYQNFKDVYDCEFIENRITLDDAKNIYGKATYNISNRMHSILLGYKYGALPIALVDTEKHIKISQTLIDNNLNELLIDVYKDKNNNIEFLIENKEVIYDKLIKVEKNKQEELMNVLDNIFNNVNN